MNVHVKIFPIAGLCDKTQKLAIVLKNGTMDELLEHVQEQLGVTLYETETIIFLHNGCALDRHKETVFKDGDQLWLLPLISGG